MNPHLKIFTTAPKDYDYWYAMEANAKVAVDSKGRYVREVHVDSESHAENQRARYQSAFVYMAVDQAEFDKLVAHGLVTISA